MHSSVFRRLELQGEVWTPESGILWFGQVTSECQCHVKHEYRTVLNKPVDISTRHGKKFLMPVTVLTDGGFPFLPPEDRGFKQSSPFPSSLPLFIPLIFLKGQMSWDLCN